MQSSKIPIKNIYYMLAYAFKCLRTGVFKKLSSESFDNIENLFAEILILGLRSLVKQGLLRGYEETSDGLSSPHGRLNVSETLKSGTLLKRKIVCTFDEFTENIEFNRIVKTTCVYLNSLRDVDLERKTNLRKLMGNFMKVQPIDLHLVDWNKRFNRNNQTYKMLIYVCHWLYLRKIQTEEGGTNLGKSFYEERKLSNLYEKFVFEFFRQEYSSSFLVNASHIEWQLDFGSEIDLLPTMKTDITLRRNSKILIIDAKYYGQEMQSNRDVETIRSGHLYQIFAYVKNKAWEMRETGIAVSGMLLYAKTDAAITLDKNYSMSGNQISVKNLDLNVSFEDLRKPLDVIAKDFIEKG